MSSSSYTLRQTILDEQYKRAWEDAPPEFKQQAEEMGLHPAVDSNSSALAFDDNRRETSTFTCMPDEIDTCVDFMIEKYGASHEHVVRGIFADLKKIMDIEVERNRALSLGRMLFYLVNKQTKSILPLLHAALHAIPRLAAANGITSMRESARLCGVSPEWIRRSRDEICDVLEIPVPVESQKSLDAKVKYSVNGKLNHWRSQTTKKGIICQTQHKHPNGNSRSQKEKILRSESPNTELSSSQTSNSMTGEMD